MASFTVGDVRPAGEHDIKVFKNLMDDDSTWKKVFTKKETVVYVKNTENSPIQMVKVKINAVDLSAADLYDTLMDPDYRRSWDKYMVEGYDLCLVSPNTDIGYYLVKSFPPFKNRDSVTLRSWFQYENEYIIMNHSVFHAAEPPKKEYVRAISYLSGYIVRKTGPSSCFFGFVTQSDPRGKFPSWAVNKIAQIIAPSTVSKLVKAARAYPQWKAQNSPSIKPWIYPEQNKLAPLNFEDILSSPDFEMSAKDETEEIEVPEDASSTIAETSENLVDDDKGCESDKTAVSNTMPEVVEEAIVPQCAPGPAQRSIPIG
ncbi:unnamed protein product [Hymenolepis diminuta]|uniref:START domain-containing protein 10 n=1 Tax=Hymenolepis diminuta TaxID=6216 RepID=A0A158QDZ0_HYMDI|nr:unnamed protein product [Hymenolepis diminuta]